MDLILDKDSLIDDCMRKTRKLKQPKHLKPHPYRRINRVQKTILSAIQDKKLALFSCIVCKNILRQPVTVKCGHTLCMECLDNFSKKCSKCFIDFEEQPKVNILVQTLIEKWKERNKIDDIGKLHFFYISGFNIKHIDFFTYKIVS